MAALASDLSRTILQQTEAAKTFRPWWDIVEDGLLYSLVILSLVTLPMTFLSGNPVDCAIHRNYWMYENSSAKMPSQTRYIQSYAKKYCTETHLSIFLLYLPITILIVPLTLTAVEKFFIKVFNTEKKLDIFFSMLVKESLSTEDVGTLETTHIKDIHEIRQAFRNSDNCYKSYLYRTTFEIVVNMALFMLFMLNRNEHGFLDPFFDCLVHNTSFECVIPNSKFFFIVYVLCVIILIGYFCCSTFNLLWIVTHRLRILRKFLKKMRKEFSKRRDEFDNESPLASSLEIYFDRKSPDFGMLMDLLAECDGITQAFRILTIFDRQFREGWVTQDFKIANLAIGSENDVEKAENSSICIEWDDCILAEFAHQNLGKSILEYTLEIQLIAEEKSVGCSLAGEISIKSFQYYSLAEPLEDVKISDDVQLPNQNGFNKREKELDEVSLLKYDISKPQIKKNGKYHTTFCGLEPDKEYKLTISTEIDGQTITQSSYTYRFSESSTQKDKEEDTKSLNS